MKKGEIYEGIVENMDFPNKGNIYIEGERVIVKNALPGQKVRFLVNKRRKGKCEGRLLSVREDRASVSPFWNLRRLSVPDDSL